MFEPHIIAIWLAANVAFNIPLVYIAFKHRKAKATPFILAGIIWALASYGALERLISYPMPLHWEWFPAAKYEVLAFQIKDGDAVYLWLQPEGGGPPRYYVVPWMKGKKPYGKAMADRLMSERAKARSKGGKLIYEPSLRRDPSGGLKAQEPLKQPEKQYER